MAVSKRKQRLEAIENLRALIEAGLNPKVLEDFERGIVNCSQSAGDCDGRCATLVAPLDKERLGAVVREFETKHGHLVYHAILEEMSFGTVFYLLYASVHEDDVEGHRADIAALCPMVFGANLSDPDYSEFGFAPIRVSEGGLRYDFS